MVNILQKYDHLYFLENVLISSDVSKWGTNAISNRICATAHRESISAQNLRR